MAALLLPAVNQARESGRRNTCSNNLKQIALAMQNYADAYGTFPPAYLADADGNPMHSWRVLILPFIENGAPFARYRFDEPWDGPNNRKLAAEMPSVYRCPSDAPSGNNTSYVVVTDPGTMFDGEQSTSPEEIRHRASTTLMIVEVAGESINWMAPEDLDAQQMPFTIGGPGSGGISSGHAGGAEVAFADGSVRFVAMSIDANVLRALIDANAKIEMPPEP